jgi:curli biogenesis system outer membrane secretion channel CsgG
MKIYLITLFIAPFFFFCSAQQKQSIAILPFTYSNCNVSDAISISENVVNALVKTKRFNIVDRTKMEEINKEKNLQKTEAFMDGDALVEQGKSLGAQFLISGNVSSVVKNSPWKTRTKADGTTETYQTHECSISFSCKVLDITTGQITNSEAFTTNANGLLGLSFANNIDEAFGKSLNSLSSAIDSWIGRNFPLVINLVEISEKDKKGGAAKILVSAGTELGMTKNEKLKVVEISFLEVNGEKKERRKEIGEAKISSVDDANFSTCTITSGALEIAQKIDAGAKLMLITIK